MSMELGEMHSIPAIQVHQWLEEWDDVPWSEGARQRKPDKQHFYMLALSAKTLRHLCGIERRTDKDFLPRSEDFGPQRFHDEKRSEEISRFIHFGFPWSDIPAAKRQTSEYMDLRKPGWLPTAIVVNIIRPGESRTQGVLKDEYAIKIDDHADGTATFHVPTVQVGSDETRPMEVIDGQHRLWAFDEDTAPEDYQLPVVAFDGLDRSWQAYLFWTINIRPKRLNSSLAFDLYPLLRTEEWLERFSGHSIYRETRAQELVEALWSHPQSPWRGRINMLGQPSSLTGEPRPMVSQNAWIRSLYSTYVKRWEDTDRRIGGLFGAPIGSDQVALPWSRSQQAAYLIFVWQQLKQVVALCEEEWATQLRHIDGKSSSDGDPAFIGEFSLLTTDQGVRGVLYVTNDLVFVRADELNLPAWRSEVRSSATDVDAVSTELQGLQDQPVAEFIREITSALTGYDWRTSASPGLSNDQVRFKSALRGSGGYRLLRVDLLRILNQSSGVTGHTAAEVMNRLGI